MTILGLIKVTPEPKQLPEYSKHETIIDLDDEFVHEQLQALDHGTQCMCRWKSKRGTTMYGIYTKEHK